MSGFGRRLAIEDHLDIWLSTQLAFSPGATSTTIGGSRSFACSGNVKAGCFATLSAAAGRAASILS